MYDCYFLPKYPFLLRVVLRQPGCILLMVCLVIHGCAETNGPVRKTTESQRDRGPDHPVDRGGVPDPTPRWEPKSRYGNPISYEVWGERYYVMNDSEHFVEKGIASWYGSEFHGRRTSSGETYDMYAMTAAHKTLPLPTYLQVKNTENGRTIVVRVNDRGPFHDDRIIDLSYTAAIKLGIVKAGTGDVEIRDITPRKRQIEVAESALAKRNFMVKTAHSERANLYIQVGAFKNLTNANKLIDSIRAFGLPGVRIKAGMLDRHTVYRVHVGPMNTPGEAQRVIARLSELGVTSARVVTDPVELARPVLQ